MSETTSFYLLLAAAAVLLLALLLVWYDLHRGNAEVAHELRDLDLVLRGQAGVPPKPRA